MKITKVTRNKKRYLPLLLLADEEETMLDRYLERGTMYVLHFGNKKPCHAAAVSAPRLCQSAGAVY